MSPADRRRVSSRDHRVAQHNTLPEHVELVDRAIAQLVAAGAACTWGSFVTALRCRGETPEARPRIISLAPHGPQGIAHAGGTLSSAHHGHAQVHRQAAHEARDYKLRPGYSCGAPTCGVLTSTCPSTGARCRSWVSAGGAATSLAWSCCSDSRHRHWRSSRPATSRSGSWDSGGKSTPSVTISMTSWARRLHGTG